MQKLEFNDDNDSTIASSVAASNENRRSAVNCQNNMHHMDAINSQIFFDREYNSDTEEDDDEEYCDQPSQL